MLAIGRLVFSARPQSLRPVAALASSAPRPGTPRGPAARVAGAEAAARTARAADAVKVPGAALAAEDADSPAPVTRIPPVTAPAISRRHRAGAPGNRRRPRAASPAGRQRHSLRVARGSLNSDHRSLMQFVQVTRASIGTRAAQSRGYRVNQVLDTRALRVQVHPGGRYALLEQLLASPLEGRVSGGPQPDRPRRRHAEALLVQPSFGIPEHVPR